MLLGGGAVTNHTAQIGAARGHKCKGPVPKTCDTAQKQDIELHCNLTVPGQPSLSKGAAALKPGRAGSEAALGLFMATTWKRVERQAEGKNKSGTQVRQDEQQGRD